MKVLIYVGIGVAVLAAVIGFLCSIYRVAEVDKVLIVTGGKKPVIKVSGGSFVMPIFRKAQFFDLCMLTVKADRDEIKTKTAVPIITDWTAQIRPDTQNIANLEKAIISFKERGQDGIINDIKETLTGAVRDIVASMTPEEVLREKTIFAEKVREIVSDEMLNMGMELVSLNIQDISDNNGYYDNIAALDMEDKRLAAENKKADIDQDVRKKKAEAEKNASQSELASELAIAEKERDNALKIAGFKAEKDKANADAAVAGKLQSTIRQQEVAEHEGRVEVIRQEQANLAATKEKEVIITRAEAQKQKTLIEADANANVKRINADAQVEVAEREAKAVKVTAEADAEKVQKEGKARAEVTKMNGEAEASIIKQKGFAEAEAEKAKLLAQAEAEKAKLLAQAEGEKAKLLAQAEGEKQLAEARASNDKVNFEIEKIRIEQEARVQIATNMGQMMAEIGKNAEFVNIGGAQTGVGASTGNVLIDTLMAIPEIMKCVDTKNMALNGEHINDTVKGIVDSIAGPAKGLLVNNSTEAVPSPDDKSPANK